MAAKFYSAWRCGLSSRQRQVFWQPRLKASSLEFSQTHWLLLVPLSLLQSEVGKVNEACCFRLQHAEIVALLTHNQHILSVTRSLIEYEPRLTGESKIATQEHFNEIWFEASLFPPDTSQDVASFDRQNQECPAPFHNFRGRLQVFSILSSLEVSNPSFSLARSPIAC